MVRLFYALMLMLLTKFVPNSTIRRCCSSIYQIHFNNKLAPNLLQIVPKKINQNLQKLRKNGANKVLALKCTNLEYYLRPIVSRS